MIDLLKITRRSAVMLLAGAAFAPAQAQTPPAKVLKIGSLCTLTGPSASIGKESFSGLQYGVKKINDAGGVKIGADTYRLELVNVDDESKAEKAAAAGEKLISGERVNVLFTAPASTSTLAVLPLAERSKTLTMSFVSAAEAVTAPEYSYSFRNTLYSIMNVSPAVEFLMKEKKAKTIAFLGRNDEWGRTAGKQAIAKAKELGGSVVVAEYFDIGNTDFYGLLTKVRGANPDALVFASYIEDGVSLVKQYRELQMKPTLMSIAVILSSPTFLKSAGKAAEGMYISTGPTTSTTPDLEAFSAEFQRTSGHPALPYEITSYDSLNLVLEAMKKAGTIDSTAVRDTMKNFEYKGLLQTYKFAGTNQSQVVININEVKDGRVVPLSSLLTN